MRIMEDGNQLLLEDMTEKELRPFTWRNLGGAERKDKNGRIVNAAGKRSITLFIPDEYVQLFVDRGAIVKEYGGDPESGEPPLHFVVLKCNTESRRPPVIEIKRVNNTKRTLTPDEYGRVDGMTVKRADAMISFYHYQGSPDATVYLNFLGIEPAYNPIQEKWAAMDEIADADDMSNDMM